METIALRHWQADGLRWLGGLLVGLAEGIERRLDRPAAITSNELHFDSDSYLAELRNDIQRKYY